MNSYSGIIRKHGLGIAIIAAFAIWQLIAMAAPSLVSPYEIGQCLGAGLLSDDLSMDYQLSPEISRELGAYCDFR